MHQGQTSAATGHQRYASASPQASSPDSEPPPADGCWWAKRSDYPLYDPRFEHDACGMGFVANMSGSRDHRVVERALEALANLAHRGAMDADADATDGVGVMTPIPRGLLPTRRPEHGPR